jgi:inhibitor of cysteine peptidase
MRRWKTLGFALCLGILAMAAALLLQGCARSAPVTLGEGDSGHTIKVNVGQQITVRLPSNPSTGYSWSVATLGGLQQVGEATYKATETSGVVGSGGTQSFTFSGRKRGSGQLTLEYRRPWEKGTPAAKTWTVVVFVQ